MNNCLRALDVDSLDSSELQLSGQTAKACFVSLVWQRLPRRAVETPWLGMSRKEAPRSPAEVPKLRSTPRRFRSSAL